MNRVPISRTSNLTKTGSFARSFSTSPFPVRPGYGLGSWIPKSVVSGMKEEAKFRSSIVVLNQIEADIESTMRELLLEKNQMENKLNRDQTIPITPDVWVALNAGLLKMGSNRSKIILEKIAMYQALFTVQEKLMAQALLGNTGKSLSTFASGIESGIDFERSKIVHLPRAFDSITVNARFYDRDIITQSAASHSATVTTAAKTTVNAWFSNFSGQIAHAVSNSMTATSERHEIESTLLVTAYATHSKVRQFSPLILDCDKLLAAWNFYHPGQKLVLERLSPADLMATDLNPDEPTIDMLSECFLGSAMVGMVHFIKSESTMTMQQSTKAAMQAMASVKYSSLFASITGETGISTNMAAKAAQSLSSTGVDVKFDLLCLGYLPTIKSSTIQTTVKAFADFDPAKFSVDSKDEQDPDLDGVSNNLLMSNKNTAQKQSNMASVIKATVMGVAAMEAQSYQVLDYNTFMNAFDDYTKNAATTEGVGVAIGMNLKSLTKRDVITELSKKYFRASPYRQENLAGGGDTNTSGTSGGTTQ